MVKDDHIDSPRGLGDLTVENEVTLEDLASAIPS